MATGWARDGAVQEQIDDSINDEVMRARSKLVKGESQLYCSECGDEIPAARRHAVPGVRTCVTCQSEIDQRPVTALFNRRYSKDSQLK